MSNELKRNEIIMLFDNLISILIENEFDTAQWMISPKTLFYNLHVK